VIGFVYPEYCFPAQKQGGKRNIGTSTSSGAPKPKRAKVLTRRPKLHSLENMVVDPTTEKVKLVESVEAIPLAMETVPAMPAEVSADPVKELGPKKIVEEQAKLLSPPTVAGLLLVTCYQILLIKNKATQSLRIRDLRLLKHYLHMSIMLIRQRSRRTYLHHLICERKCKRMNKVIAFH
jgi:hypothetical protein